MNVDVLGGEKRTLDLLGMALWVTASSEGAWN